jgi:hypothetical protein
MFVQRMMIAAGAGALLLAAPAHAQTTLSASQTRSLEEVTTRLQEVVAQLAAEESLSAAETDELRRTLAALYRDLRDLRGGSAAVAVDSFTAPVSEDDRVQAADAAVTNDASPDAWVRFGEATVRVSPTTARFSGWQAGNDIKVSYGDTGEILLNVTNGGYSANWRLRNAYTGGVKTTVTPETDGDILLRIEDSRGTHHFMIKDGGTGPIYIKGSAGPATPSAQASGVQFSGTWFRAYRDSVTRGTLQRSEPMEWLIRQYEDDSFASSKLRDLGVVLGDLEGTPLRTEAIAVLRYNTATGERTLDFPDPRRSPAGFAAALRTLYDLQQGGQWFDFEFVR